MRSRLSPRRSSHPVRVRSSRYRGFHDHDPTGNRCYEVCDSQGAGALSELFQVLHVVLAGVWLGGVVFTTAVVSPALKALKWSETERVGVRSAICRQYARVGSANLALLLLFAILDGTLSGFGALFYAEYSSLLLLFGLVVAHGAYFGRRLA